MIEWFSRAAKASAGVRVNHAAGEAADAGCPVFASSLDLAADALNKDLRVRLSFTDSTRACDSGS